MGSGARPRWVPAREFVRIQGHAIAGGLFYLGRQGRGEFTDGCYIDPDLPARRRRLWESEGCPIYWAPRYDSMARQYRGAYLAWLAGGRCDPKVDIGYVLLFFHGLERRFFIDGQKGIVPLEEKVLIIREVKRLMRVYKQKYLLEDYGTDFLAAVWALHHQKPVIPKYIDPVRNVYTGLFRLILGEHVAAKKRLPPRMAYQWTVLATEKPYKIDKYFHHEKMQELFAIRYAQSFGEGLLVKPNKKRLELLYSPANPSLREERIRLHGPDLPDPFSLRGPMGKLSPLWSACAAALEPHQRYVRSYKQQEESVRALALLPKELIVNSSWAKMVLPRLQARVRDDSDPLTVKQLCELLEKPLPACLNKQQVTALCVLLEHLGFGCAPDPRVYQQRMVSDTPVVLFVGGHGGKTLPSAAFQTTAETIRFGAFVAQTCGVTQRARDVARRHIDTRRFDPPQRNSLTAWSAWCFAVRQTMSGSRIKKLADVSQEARAALCGVVAAMARLVPRSVAPERIRKLQKIYKSLDLDEKQALIDMHRAVANEEPVMVMQRDPARTFAIPRSPHPDAAVTSKELRLDADLIRRRRQETAAVKNVLQDIFASEDPAGHGTQEADGVDQGEEGELDIPHRRLLRELITQEQWPQGELDAKCRALNLMTDGALETLNEWSLRQADALIVHNGDPICVDIAVAREILNHDGA